MFVKHWCPLQKHIKNRTDLSHWPFSYNLNINRVHELVMDYLPTKFEASGTKGSWVISCTMCGIPKWPLTFTFDQLTWILTEIIYSSRTTYLTSLKLFLQSFLALSISQGLENIMTSDLDLCPTNLTINRDHLLITDYLPTKFETSRAMRSCVISCTMLRDIDIPTDRHVQSNMPLLQRGHNNLNLNLIYIKKEDLKWMVEEFKKSPDDLFEDQLHGYKHEEFSSALHPIGTRVRRGPTWQYKNQDGGGPGTVVGQQRAKHELGKMVRMTTI